jgi:hypothetical protein
MPKMTSLVARLGHLEPSVLGLDVYDARTEGAVVHVQEPARGAEGTSLSPLERTTKCGVRRRKLGGQLGGLTPQSIPKLLSLGAVVRNL